MEQLLCVQRCEFSHSQPNGNQFKSRNLEANSFLVSKLWKILVIGSEIKKIHRCAI